MKRLFYFTGYRLTVMHWEDNKLIGSSSFEPTDAGLADFRHYLEQTENITSRFLVDVIEEDFRNETVPHVNAKDRQAVISRLIDRHYRSSHNYSYSEIVGREKTGRKDDKVLLGAMTNPQLIQPWMTILDECEVPLSGILTLPLLSKKILKTIEATNGAVLLVSQQVNSNVRQTLFRDGKLVASRQSIVNQDINDISNIGDLAAPEVERTIEFLRAQGHIDKNEVLDLHIIGGDEQLLSLEESFKVTEVRKVSIHRISEIKDKLAITGISEQFSDGLFAYLCISPKILPGHYGSKEIFKRHHNKLAVMFLYAASLFIMIVGVLMTQSNISSAWEFEKSIGLLKKEEINYKALYSNKFKKFEEVFQNAGVMNAAVDLADRIKNNSETSPLDFLVSISNTLSKVTPKLVSIDKIEWKAMNVDEKNRQSNRASKKINFTTKEPIKHNALLVGRINVSESSYRESIDQIQSIIDTLKSNPRVESVTVLSMPVDLRSESKFSTESGINVTSVKSKDNSGAFSLEIVMQGDNHV